MKEIKICKNCEKSFEMPLPNPPPAFYGAMVDGEYVYFCRWICFSKWVTARRNSENKT